MAKLQINNTPVRYVGDQIEDAYFCLTDMCKGFDDEPEFLIRTWLRNKSTVEFIEVWELEHNEDFNYTEFGIIKN